MEFKAFNKIPRWNRDITITEKIDGTNAQIGIVRISEHLDTKDAVRVIPGFGNGEEALAVFAGSRSRWLTEKEDNFGFAKWVSANAEELIKLGEGRFFGEWWGQGVQRKYGLSERRFSLFHDRGVVDLPACVGVVPVLYQGENNHRAILDTLIDLDINGSKAAPGFMNPEGIVIHHSASGHVYKVTLKDDAKPKSSGG